MKIKLIILFLPFIVFHSFYSQNRYEENLVVMDHDTMFYKKDMQKLTGLVYNKHGDVGIFNQGLGKDCTKNGLEMAI